MLIKTRWTYWIYCLGSFHSCSCREDVDMAELDHIQHNSDVTHRRYIVGFAVKLLECVPPAVFLLVSLQGPKSLLPRVVCESESLNLKNEDSQYNLSPLLCLLFSISQGESLSQSIDQWPLNPSKCYPLLTTANALHTKTNREAFYGIWLLLPMNRCWCGVSYSVQAHFLPCIRLKLHLIGVMSPSATLVQIFYKLCLLQPQASTTRSSPAAEPQGKVTHDTCFFATL